MKPKLALSDGELLIVTAILRENLPEDVSLHVFGSRARGRVKNWSDLDLVLEGPAQLPLSLIAVLKEAFENSDLPWKVDIVDRRSVSAEFGRIIDLTKVPFN